MYRVKEYITEQGRNPFQRWLKRLAKQQAARIGQVLVRVSNGLLRDTKHVGDGVYELRLHIGPGYRIYFGRDGEDLIILLIGGDKSSQQRDIDRAQRYWREYRRRVGDDADSMQNR